MKYLRNITAFVSVMLIAGLVLWLAPKWQVRGVEEAGQRVALEIAARRGLIQILGGLAKVAHIDALDMALARVDDEELQAEALAACCRIAGSIGRLHRDEAKAAPSGWEGSTPWSRSPRNRRRTTGRS